MQGRDGLRQFALLRVDQQVHDAEQHVGQTGDQVRKRHHQRLAEEAELLQHDKGHDEHRQAQPQPRRGTATPHALDDEVAHDQESGQWRDLGDVVDIAADEHQVGAEQYGSAAGRRWEHAGEQCRRGDEGDEME